MLSQWTKNRKIISALNREQPKIKELCETRLNILIEFCLLFPVQYYPYDARRNLDLRVFVPYCTGLKKQVTSRKFRYQINFDGFKRQYKWLEVKYQGVHWSFNWKVGMRNSTRSLLFWTSNRIFPGSFVSRLLVKGNEDPGYKGASGAYSHPRVFQQNLNDWLTNVEKNIQSWKQQSH